MNMKKDKYDYIHQRALSRSVAHIFEEAEKQYDIVDFSLIFIHSSFFKNYFDDFTIFSQSKKYALQVFWEEMDKEGVILPTNTLPQYDGDVAYWLGYLFSEWWQEYGLDMNIVTKDHVEWLYNNYDVLHTQSVKYVYEDWKDTFSLK